MPTVLVTGSSGFLGRALVSELLDRGCDVVAVSRNQNTTLREGARHARFDELHAFKGAACIHAAGANGIADQAEAVRERASAQGLAAQVLAAEFARVVFVSSAAVYGEGATVPRSEDGRTTPVTAYGQLKRDLEHLFLPNHTVARVANLYGPGMSPGNVFSDIIKQIPTGLITLRNLTAVRDYLYVHDAAAALAGLALTSETGLFNVSTGRGTPVATLARMLAAAMGSPDCPIRALENNPPPSHIVLDPARLHRTTGWRALTPLENGLTLLTEALR